MLKNAVQTKPEKQTFNFNYSLQKVQKFKSRKIIKIDSIVEIFADFTAVYERTLLNKRQ